MTDATFWKGRWQEGRTGWHLDTVNPHLIQFWNVPSPSRVLVPLCGATLDLRWLASRGHEVVGVDLAEDAEATCRAQGPLPDNLTFVQADLFDFQDKPFDAIWDRAALIALPAERRADYVAHLLTLLKPRGPWLLNTYVTRPVVEGPPFSVSSDEVQQLFENEGPVEHLTRNDIFATSSRYAEKGLSEAWEDVFKFIRN